MKLKYSTCRSIAGSKNEFNFNAVFERLGQEGYASDALFTYLCSLYSGLPDRAGHSRLVQSLSWEFMSAWDDKRSLALKLQQNGCEEAFAPTFMNCTAALCATQGDPSALFFVKEAQGSRGWGMRVVTRNELLSCQLSSSQIIQQAIQYLTLVNGCKFVVRYYLLVHNKKLFLHRRGVMIVHGAPYVTNSQDIKVQIAHDFDQPGSTAHLIALHSLVQWSQWHKSIAQRVTDIMPALQPLIDATSADCYAFIGGDALIEYTGDAKLIELNPFPAMCANSDEFNSQVSQFVLRDLVTKTLFGANNTEFDELHCPSS